MFPLYDKPFSFCERHEGTVLLLCRTGRKKTISTYQLAIPCSLFYAHPLDFLHDAADTQKDEFLYHYLRFKITLQEAEAEENA